MDTITQFTVKQPRQMDHNDDSHNARSYDNLKIDLMIDLMIVLRNPAQY